MARSDDRHCDDAADEHDKQHEFHRLNPSQSRGGNRQKAASDWDILS
jgi:hypothetical protein